MQIRLKDRVIRIPDWGYRLPGQQLFTLCDEATARYTAKVYKAEVVSGKVAYRENQKIQMKAAKTKLRRSLGRFPGRLTKKQRQGKPDKGFKVE